MPEETGQTPQTDPVPEVSVVIATYNRSYVLVHGVQSVLDSTFQDFEILVIGDCCTDDTERRLAEFNDPRIRFENLSVNHGEQSEPNNRGVQLARGKFLAFLNHDDLYLPEHLQLCLSELKQTSAPDLVWTATVWLKPPSEGHSGTMDWGFEIKSVPDRACFSPFVFCPASSWVMTKGTFDRIGNWRPWWECHVTPSQDWLFRAWKKGVRLHFIPRVSVVFIPSGSRPGSYASRTSPEHEAVMQALRGNPDFPKRMLESAAVDSSRELAQRFPRRPLKLIARVLAYPMHQLLLRIGVHPLALNNWLRFWGRGDLIRRHHRFVGLPGTDRKKER